MPLAGDASRSRDCRSSRCRVKAAAGDSGRSGCAARTRPRRARQWLRRSRPGARVTVRALLGFRPRGLVTLQAHLRLVRVQQNRRGPGKRADPPAGSSRLALEVLDRAPAAEEVPHLDHVALRVLDVERAVAAVVLLRAAHAARRAPAGARRGRPGGRGRPRTRSGRGGRRGPRTPSRPGTTARGGRARRPRARRGRPRGRAPRGRPRRRRTARAARRRGSPASARRSRP